MVQQWRGPPWNAPIWPLLPLLLNRSIEVAALCLKNVFTSITVSPCLLPCIGSNGRLLTFKHLS